MKKFLALILALCLAAALCGCGGGEPTDTATVEQNGSTVSDTAPVDDTIVVGISADLDSSLDPHVSSSSAGTREVLFNVFEGLMKPDTDGNLIPAVAESYSVNESADEYTFTLREGVRFQNDEPVTVGDVVYSVSRAAGLETGEPLVANLASVVSVEATDDKTVVITLSAPDAEFVAYLTTSAAIVPEGSDPAEDMIGTGPYKFVSRKVQEEILLERFEGYWGTPAKTKSIELKVIEDIETMVMSLRSGAVDLAAHLEAAQVQELDGLTICEGSMNLVQALYLNNAVEPFDNELVRQALCCAIDKYGVIELAGDGHGFATGTSMYPAFGKYFDESLVDYYTPDAAKAKELLAEAGYPDGFTFTIKVPSNYQPHVDAAQVISYQLEQLGIGVTAEIEQIDWNTWYDDVYKGCNFEATVCGMDASTLTGSALLARFTSDSAKNFIGFSDPDYDTAFAAAVATTDETERAAYYGECQRILTERAANVYIQDLADFVAMQSDIEGYTFYPLYVMDLSTICRVG